MIAQGKESRWFRNSLAAIMVVLCMLLSADSALASKSHRYAGADPTLTAAYDPATNHVLFAGCGYDFDAAAVGDLPILLVTLPAPLPSGETTLSYVVGVHSDGCLDGAYITAQVSGTYGVEIYQQSTGVLLASTTVEVP